jgi:hypothetical protein
LNTFAATGNKRQHVNGELQMPACIDGVAIDAMIDTVSTPLAATEVNVQHVNGAESELQNAMDRAVIVIVKGMISFTFFVEQFQIPVEFLISNRLSIFLFAKL